MRLEKNKNEDGLVLEVNIKLDARGLRNLRSKYSKQEEDESSDEKRTRNPNWNLSDELDASTSALFDWTTKSSPSSNEASDSASSDAIDTSDAISDSSQTTEEVCEEIGLPDADLYRVRSGLHWIDRNHFYLRIDEDKGPQKHVPEPWGRSQIHEDSVPEMTVSVSACAIGKNYAVFLAQLPVLGHGYCYP